MPRSRLYGFIFIAAALLVLGLVYSHRGRTLSHRSIQFQRGEIPASSKKWHVARMPADGEVTVRREASGYLAPCPCGLPNRVLVFHRYPAGAWLSERHCQSHGPRFGRLTPA